MRRQVNLTIGLFLLVLGTGSPIFAALAQEPGLGLVRCCSEQDLNDCRDEYCSKPVATGDGTVIAAGGVMVGAGYLLVTYWEDVKDGLAAAWNGIEEGASAVGGFFKTVGEGIADGAKAVWCFIVGCGGGSPPRVSDESYQQLQDHRQKVDSALENVRSVNEQIHREIEHTRDERGSAAESLNKKVVEMAGVMEQNSSSLNKQSEEIDHFVQSTLVSNNDAVQGLDEDILGDWQNVLPETNPNLPPPAQPGLGDGSLVLKTGPDNPGYENLVHSAEYHQSAVQMVASGVAHPAESKGLLTLAEMSLVAADESYSKGLQTIGDVLADAANSVVDMVYSIRDTVSNEVKDVITKGSNFTAGFLRGVVGVPVEPYDGYEKYFYAGEAVGTATGLLGDAAMILEGFVIADGGLVLSLASGGTLAPAGALAIGAGASLSAAGVASAGLHWDSFKETMDQLTQHHMWMDGDGIPPESPKGLTGTAFEKWIQKTLGGEESFIVDKRQFDGKIGNKWIEAKSGQYWVDHCQQGTGFDRFKSITGEQIKIAEHNDSMLEIHSNSQIPSHVKEWLTTKGIRYVEWLD